MATTTPNFGWPVPTSTDLVKDGATAIEGLGDAIDASLVDLKGGTTGQILAKQSNTNMDFQWITNDVGDITAVTAGTGISGGGSSGDVTITNSMATAIDAKGDLVVGTGADAFSRLAIGSNDQVLTADSTAATGMKWAAVAGGGWTSLASGSLSGTQVSITSINQGYRSLMLFVNDPWASAGNVTQLAFRINSITGAHYTSSDISTGSTTVNAQTNQTRFTPAIANLGASSRSRFFSLEIPDYTTSQYHSYYFMGNDNDVTGAYSFGQLKDTGNAAVTSIQILTANGSTTFSGGTYTLYGVK